MARDDRNVKSDPAGTNLAALIERCLTWIEYHPRTGWYIALLATLNFFLNLVDAFDLF
jgi:hypothetical protein